MKNETNSISFFGKSNTNHNTQKLKEKEVCTKHIME